MKFRTLFYLFFFVSTSLYAENVRSFDTPYKIDELRTLLENALKKFDKSRYKLKDETNGFAYHYVDSVSSPFDYDIYIGNIFAKKDLTILRIEGSMGEVQVLSRILDLEGVIYKDASLTKSSQIYKPSDKYHVIAQGINIFSPALSVVYQAYHSPISSVNQDLIKGFVYLGLDILAIWLGGNKFFTSRFEIDKNKDTVIAFLLANRIAGMGQAINAIRAHNAVVELGYTFPIE